jgi:hypothetical protein
MSAITRPALLLLSLGLFAATARAGLECAEPTVRAGDVRSGTALAHDFHLVNRGTLTLEITDLRATCGCLRPQLDRRQLAPGEEAVLHIEVNTLTQPAGMHTWMVRVGYKEGDHAGEQAVVLGARIVSEVAVQPPALNLYLQAGAAPPPEGQRITLVDYRSHPLAITSVQSSSPYLRTRMDEWRRDLAGHWTRTIAVEVADECPPGRHDAGLRILAADATYPELGVAVTVVKRSPTDVRAAPDVVSFSGSGGQPLPGRIVLLSSPDDQEVRVEHIECDDPAVQCRWAPGPGKRATLQFRVDAAKVLGGSLSTQVRVHLALPTPQVVTLPVNCTLR